MGKSTSANKQKPPRSSDRQCKIEPEPLYVCYYRVSTQRQGSSGLGLDAQREAVARYLDKKSGMVLAEFTEIESGKRNANRPKLQHALNLCRERKAELVIAKLDRLARNVFFISGLLETNIRFVAVDYPTRDRFWLHMMAAFAEEEGRRISQRTKEALAAAKRRGVDIGATGRMLAKRYNAEAIERAQQYAPLIEELRILGFVQVRQVRDELNRREVPSPGNGKWHLLNTHKLLKRLKSNVNQPARG